MIDGGPPILPTVLTLPRARTDWSSVRAGASHCTWTLVTLERREEIDMDDAELVRRINELADEEHRLERSHAAQPLPDDDHARLREIEIALDQCWDLLRQRRARRAIGEDPDEAAVRPADVVENYQQ